MSTRWPECSAAGGEPHDWQRDPRGPEEGLACAACGITEAEEAAGR